jgi:hypothetical protein
MRKIICLSLLLCSSAFAQEIYKSTDEQGNVIYSERPPAAARDVERVDPPAEPSSAEVRAAEDLQEQREQFVEQSETERTEQAQQRRELREERAPAMVPSSIGIGAPGRQRGTFAEGGEAAQGSDTASGAQGAQGADTAGRPRPNLPPRPAPAPAVPRGGGPRGP